MVKKVKAAYIAAASGVSAGPQLHITQARCSNSGLNRVTGHYGPVPAAKEKGSVLKLSV